MGRKHKFVNHTHYPDWAIERFARCIYDDVVAAFQDPEVQREYKEWEAGQARKKKEKADLEKHKR